MAIKYVQVINSFVSTEGSNGFMTNYVYYTLLVVNTNGTSEIVEGRLNQISSLLRYVRTPVDELEELKETVRGLRNDINEIVDEKVRYVLDSLFPIPDIQDKNEVEALELLDSAGLQPVFVNQYPDGVPKKGIVRAYARSSENFRMVDVEIVHDMPDVTGLKIEDAQEQLTAAGFRAEITYKVISGKEGGVILECSRKGEISMDVALVVSSVIPETSDMPQEEAVKLLEAAGRKVVTEKVVRSGEPGRVVRWECLKDDSIKLYISTPAKYEAKRVDIKWTNMQDTAGDVYSATAEFDVKQNSLQVMLTYKVGTKSKRQLIDAKMVIPGRMFPISGRIYGDFNMEPGVENTAKFTFSIEDMPKEAKIELETQYGIMKKKETVALDMTFEW